MFKTSPFIGQLLLLTLSLPVIAEEQLDQLLQRLKITQTQQFNYTETREMQLIAAPWKSSGQMYLSPDRVIIDQHQPKHSIVSITENKLLYMEPGKDTRYLKKLNTPFAIPGIGTFLALLYQDHATSEDLKKQFITQLETTATRWTLSLIPRQGSNINNMEISGLRGQQADDLHLEFSDGDQTRWVFSLVTQGQPATRAMQQILAIAVAQPQP